MVLKIKFADNTEIYALKDTAVYPSGIINMRSYMEIYLDENSMTLAELENLFRDESKTDHLEFIVLDELEETVQRTEIYEHFTILSCCGKKMMPYTDIQTGLINEKLQLFVKLEQPTYAEQMMKQIQTAYDIIMEGE